MDAYGSQGYYPEYYTDDSGSNANRRERTSRSADGPFHFRYQAEDD